MIEINLLPEHLRPKKEAAAGMRVILFAGVTVICVLIVFWGWLHFVKAKQAQAALTLIKKDEAAKAQKATKVNELKAQVAKMQLKGQTVEKLRKLRGLDWVRKLMDLTEAVDRTMGWLTAIKLSLRGSSGDLTINCRVIGKDMNSLSENVEDFLNRLGYVNGDKNAGFNSFWKDFIEGKPEEYYKGIDKTSTTGGWMVFEFVMKLRILPAVARELSVTSG